MAPFSKNTLLWHRQCMWQRAHRALALCLLSFLQRWSWPLYRKETLAQKGLRPHSAGDRIRPRTKTSPWQPKKDARCAKSYHTGMKQAHFWSSVLAQSNHLGQIPLPPWTSVYSPIKVGHVSTIFPRTVVNINENNICNVRGTLHIPNSECWL